MMAHTSRIEKKLNKKRIWLQTLRKILITVAIVLLLGLGAVTGTAVATVRGIVNELEPLNTDNLYRLLEESSFIYYLDNDEWHVLEKIETPLYREIVRYEEIPLQMQNAFTAIEDERFWQHQGIDFRRILSAGWRNFRTGTRQGASTIHQQLAKNLLLSPEQTYARKIQDIYYGRELDRKLSKEEILEVYLNTIYLGAGAYGVQAASQVYFSKNVNELNLAEMALLAGIPRNPHRYAPMKTLRQGSVRPHDQILMREEDDYVVVYNPESRQRQQLVLFKMHELGWITDTAYQEALRHDPISLLKPQRFHQQQDISSYFGDLVRQEVLTNLQRWGHSPDEARHLLYRGGLHIHSTLNMDMQQILETAFNDPEMFPEGQRNDQGNLILDEHGQVQPQAAMVVMDYRSGQILAMMGGRMAPDGRQLLNRALIPRQPGSAIKPLAVYTPAIDRGWTAAARINDSPVYLDRDRPSRPWPQNWYRQGYFGWITLRDALQWSSNVATVKLLQDVGGGNQTNACQVMFEYLGKMGISTLISRDDPYRGADGGLYHDETYATSLGGMTLGISPLEMTNAYNTLANGGIYSETVTFTRITDRYGEIMVDRPVERSRVVTEQTAYLMTDLLVHSVTYGTGHRAQLSPGNSQIPVAGKTGTTTDRKDAWFVGYTPYLSAGLWIGSDRPRELPDGSGMAASLWQQIMARLHESLEPMDFIRPADIEETMICTVSGLIANRYCRSTRQELFVKGTAPEAYCRIHAAPLPPEEPVPDVSPDSQADDAPSIPGRDPEVQPELIGEETNHTQQERTEP